MSDLSDMFPPEMQKYGLTFDFSKANDSVVALVAQCWAINSEIEAAKTSDDDANKVTHPFDVKASKDKKAAAIAAELLKAFIAACDVAISKNKNVSYHLAQTDSTVTAYLTSEMQYYRFKESPAKPVTSGNKLDELRNDRKVLTQMARKLLENFPILANDERLVKDGGKVKLPNLQGAGVRGADIPTGRYAKYKQTLWTIDGVSFPKGTDPRDLVRAIWKGTDRVGRKPADIFGPIDEARKANTDKTAVITVVINSKTVTYQEVTE